MEFLLYLFEALFRQNEQCIEQNGSEDWIALWSECENIFLCCTKQPGFLLFKPTACDPCSSCITAVKNVKKCTTQRQECVLKTDIFFSQYSDVYFRLHHKYNVVYNGPVQNCITLIFYLITVVTISSTVKLTSSNKITATLTKIWFHHGRLTKLYLLKLLFLLMWLSTVESKWGIIL